ncbi:MAG: DUF4337 domain-containing protein [Magnetococcales bacterium]|nr:DUF4337 domain-containing protein [Magnetococcales bacterium]
MSPADSSDAAPSAPACAPEHDPDARFNWGVSIAVTLLATLLGVLNVTGGNTAQAMSQEQSKAVGAWNYFQAKSTKQHLAEHTLQSMRLEQLRGGHSAEFRAALESQIAALHTQIATLVTEKEQIKEQAEGHEKQYTVLNARDDQFDVAEASINIALALLGISGVMRARWMLIPSFLVGLIGVVSGVAGFLELPWHFTRIAQWLS